MLQCIYIEYLEFHGKIIHKKVLQWCMHAPDMGYHVKKAVLCWYASIK